METVVEQSEPVAPPLKPAVSSENVGEIIRRLEAEHDLLQYELDGWCVWPVMRVHAAMSLMDLPFTKSKESFQLRELLLIAARDLPRLLFPRRSRHCVTTFSSALMEQEGDRYRDVFFDDLLEEIGSFFKIEVLNNKSFLPRSRAAYFRRDVTSTAILLLSSLVLPRLRQPPQIESLAGKLSATLRRVSGLESFSPQRVAAMLTDFYWGKRLYSRLLRRIKPVYLFTADGYSDHAMIAAARELGVKVCEFQHGCFIRGGPEYGWSSYAAAYRERMPVPDKLFVFGEYWKGLLEGDGFWEGHVSVVGNLRMDHYRKLKAARRARVPERSACHIILTTQGIDTEKLVAFVREFLSLAEGQVEINLSIKLHPAFEGDKGMYERALPRDGRVRVISGSEAPSTFELLCASDLHLSISSNCHYEALGLGVPTVILPLASCGWVLPLHRSGHAFLAQTPESLLEIVSQLRGDGIADSIGSYYFRHDALANMKNELGA